jgi:quinol monooxygenase YgiN
MATTDTQCTIAPYFKVSEGNLEAFREFCRNAVEQTIAEPGCLYYGFSFNGDEAFCREGYVNAEAALTHLANVGPLLQEVLKGIAEITRLEVHGPADELAKLREPMAGLNPTFFMLEYGFRR